MKHYVMILSKILTFDTQVINIDVSWNNRHIQKSYSWSQKERRFKLKTHLCLNQLALL